jgi:hypothetical protein
MYLLILWFDEISHLQQSLLLLLLLLLYSSYLNGYSTITRSALIILIGKMHQPIIPTQDNILILESMGHVNFKNVVSNTCFSSFLKKKEFLNKSIFLIKPSKQVIFRGFYTVSWAPNK